MGNFRAKYCTYDHIPGETHNAVMGMPSTLIADEALLYADVDCGATRARG